MPIKEFIWLLHQKWRGAVESLELISLGFSVSQKLLDVWDLGASELLDWDTNGAPSIDSQNGALTSIFQLLFHFSWKESKYHEYHTSSMGSEDWQIWCDHINGFGMSMTVTSTTPSVNLSATFPVLSRSCFHSSMGRSLTGLTRKPFVRVSSQFYAGHIDLQQNQACWVC